nr:unnamed protein product [Callosobruchus analis]
MNQLLMFLRLCATGTYLSCIADFSGAHLATVSRHVKRVAVALARLSPMFIRMPETAEEIGNAQHGFYQIARFPRVVGAVDGTHIRIKSPGGNDAEVFRNRKGYFSLNVQTVTDSQLKICNLVVRWPGSVHDVTIFNNSRIRQQFEITNNKFQNCLLLGDSGYNLRNYLLTPLQDPATRREMLYNESLIRTRNTVERQIGVWKMRFPILRYGCRLKLKTAMNVIVATGVLHNICIENNYPNPPPPEDVALLQYIIMQDEVPNIPLHHSNNVLDVQKDLIEHYFQYIDE